MNEVVQIKTEQLDDDEGTTHAMFVALRVSDPMSVEKFIKEVAQKALSHRMVSPPDTSMILFTITGELTAARFRQLWQRHVSPQTPMGVFMSRMRVADAIHGTSDGQVLDQCSLLADAN